MGGVPIKQLKAKIVSFLYCEEEQEHKFSELQICWIADLLNCRFAEVRIYWSADLVKCGFARMQICKNTAVKARAVPQICLSSRLEMAHSYGPLSPTDPSCSSISIVVFHVMLLSSTVLRYAVTVLSIRWRECNYLWKAQTATGSFNSFCMYGILPLWLDTAFWNVVLFHSKLILASKVNLRSRPQGALIANCHESPQQCDHMSFHLWGHVTVGTILG